MQWAGAQRLHVRRKWFLSQLPQHSPWRTAAGVKHRGGGTRPWKALGGELGERGDMIKAWCWDPSFSEGRVRISQELITVEGCTGVKLEGAEKMGAVRWWAEHWEIRKRRLYSFILDLSSLSYQEDTQLELITGSWKLLHKILQLDSKSSQQYGARGNWLNSCFRATTSRVCTATQRANVTSGHVNRSRA